MRILGATLLLTLALAGSAAAHDASRVPSFPDGLALGLAHMVGIAPAQDRRSRQWCGWFMRQQVDRDPGPAFNLARNWAHWGARAAGPAPGVIGVMRHHVFKVVAVLPLDRRGDARVLALSGNDGHAVRTRERSTAGVIAWRR